MTEVPPKGNLPATSRELSVYRKRPPSKSLLERLDALMAKHWGKDPKIQAVLNTRVFNGSTVEGSVMADKFAGAIYYRQLAVSEGDTELASVDLTKMKNMIGTILRRYDFSPLAIEDSEGA